MLFLINESQFSGREQVSLHYQPKQCILKDESPPNYCTFAMFLFLQYGCPLNDPCKNPREILSTLQRNEGSNPILRIGM